MLIELLEDENWEVEEGGVAAEVMSIYGRRICTSRLERCNIGGSDR